MSKFSKYTLNPDTLIYEVARMSGRTRFLTVLGALLVSFVMAAFYFWIYLYVLDLDPPKLAVLKKTNDSWKTKVAIMDRELDKCESSLLALEMRDDDIYRSVFGLDKLPQDVLHSGLGGPEKYDFLDRVGVDGTLRKTCLRLDHLTKKAFVQSKSFDEVEALSRRAGDMASCLPAIPPICPRKGSYHISSVFGWRKDPIHGSSRVHRGVDFATKTGNPIYATGDGVVESVNFQFFGYGNMVVIDHGFGYKTKYAHMAVVTVTEGMEVKRGSCIGSVGNTGRSTGSHLHYEVLYRGSNVNPANFYDLEVTEQEYAALVEEIDAQTQATLRPQFQVKSRRRKR